MATKSQVGGGAALHLLPGLHGRERIRKKGKLFSIPFILLILPTFLNGVLGNSEIESCVFMPSSSSSSSSGNSGVQNNGTNNIPLFGGNGITTTNNNDGLTFSPKVVDPHSIISCQIRTLHPDLDVENLTSSIPTMITKVKFVCNDVLFFESALRPGQFRVRSLESLHELTIEKCKLRNLPSGFLAGLRHLRKLTINTGNSEWASRSLEISAGAFENSPGEDVPSRLTHMNLGYNHIWSIPEGLLCSLSSLQSLNLTHNLLSDIDDLGLSASAASASSSSSGDAPGSCLPELKSLDLSFGTLRNLGSSRLQLQRLQNLRLDYNWLEEIEDSSFAGLGQLRSLNLSSNRLVALPTKLFQPCKLLRELDLRNNSLAALPAGILSELENLQVLDLSHNSLSSDLISSEAFKSLVLIILNLSHNQLTHLASSTFDDLYTLQILDLSNNMISTIAEGTFAPMRNLHSLNLSKNRLVFITSNMFNGLYVLHKLILDYNMIREMDESSLKNCTSLQDLALVGNHLGPNVPQALRGLQNLKTLDLGENKISLLTNESFLGMGQLIGLRLVGQQGQLEEIPKGLCDPMSRLRVFNAAQNRISKISPGAFSSCSDLRVLRLDSNKLEGISPSLAPQLPNLLWLNISENGIRRIDYALLPSTLEWLDASYNQLESLLGAWTNFNGISNGNKHNNGSIALLSQGRGGGGVAHSHQHGGASSSHHHSHSHQGFGDHPNARLRVVDASHNLLTQLDHHAIPPHIEILRLNDNRLQRILPDSFARSSNLRRVELIGNQLENIPLNALRLPRVVEGRPLPEFFLGGNPFVCDCEMEWLTRINQLSALRQHPIVLDLDTIVCRLAYSRTVTHIPLPDTTFSDFLCPYISHCFHLCHCCEFSACDCLMSCPDNCTCYHDQQWSANVVNCARTGHKAIPSRLPMDSTAVYLDGNNIPLLKSHTFIGRKNLKVLFLNGSRVETISNKSFNGLQSLQTLHLEDNRLKVINGYEFDHLSRLRELYLQNNIIEVISNTSFLPLKSLEILRLDGNRLVVFNVYQLSLNPYLVEVGLANPWNCDCQFLHQLYGWVTDNSKKVVDLSDLVCVSNNKRPHLIDYNRTCLFPWALEDAFDFTSPLPLALAFVSFATLLILVVALVILCRENLNLWLFTRFNFRLCRTPEFEDKGYDAYLIYSQKDEEFVAQRIADELETNDNYRLCLHYRDLICETGDLKEMMVGAVENSKSVVIILSRNFLQGEWSSGEYRSAFHAVLKKSQKGANISGSGKAPPKKILIVFIEDIPKVEINPDIRSWVRHNKIKVIRWNIHSADYKKNRKFWNKLKFTLPDPSSHYHSNITSNTTTTSASSGESHGGIMATLKYSTAMQNDSQLHHHHHPLPHSHMGQHAHHLPHHHHQNHPHHHQIIVDESGRFTTTTTTSLTPSSATNTLNSVKYWPYGATNFVALPPKYQKSHHGSVGGGSSHPPSMHSPGSPSLHYHPPLPLTNPPKSPPSSQSTDSTTTTMADEAPSLLSQLTMASFHTNNSRSNNSPSISMNNGCSSSSATKSPVPVPKSSYSSRNTLVNNPVSNTSTSSNNISASSSSTTSNNSGGEGGGGRGGGGGGGGESYLSIDGEHVYSTLDPPSPQPTQQSMSLSQNILGGNSSNLLSGSGGAPNFLNNIHLPNGYTYQPQSPLSHHQNNHQQQQQHHHHQQQQQWLGAGGNGAHPHPSHSLQQGGSSGKNHGGQHHHHQVMSSFVGNGSANVSNSNGGGSGGGKGFKQKVSDGNNPVQTYLV
ncbi:unnamed protein product [Orchesella dallaii]|uniref:TIR domain-containing protein n=1 Tax=Orchesella dallaii TaxID=48710 RepID=A0ABP1QVE4_9HEXA